MEKVITIDKINKIEMYNLFDSYLLVNKNFSAFHINGLSNKTCLSLIDRIHNKNKKAYILIDRILINEELEELKVFIYRLEEKGIDGYFFSDLGVLQLLKNLELLDKAILYSQTQIVSGLELSAYKKLGLKTIFVSKDLPYDNLLKASNKYDVVGVNVFGYRNLFYSKRLLLSAYKEEFKLKDKFINSNKYLIREQKREVKSIIFEDQYGTYVFTDYIENHLNEISELDQNHVKMILFDDNFISSDLMEKVIAYLEEPKGLFNLSSKEKDTYVK